MCLTPTGPQYCSLRGFTVTSSSHAYTSKRLALSPSLAGFQLVVDELVRKKRGEPLRKPSDRERKPRPQLRRRMSAWGSRCEDPGRLVAIGDVHGDRVALVRALSLAGAVDGRESW